MSSEIDAVVLFSKYEKMALGRYHTYSIFSYIHPHILVYVLERIVGRERCDHMIESSNKTTFVFK